MSLGHLQGKRVLVIDDSDAMRSQMQQTFTGTGCARLLTVPNIRQALEAMGKKHLIGSRRDCLVPAPTLDEMREARRQNRHTRPALTKHTPIAHQRQTPAAAGAKKRVKPKAVSR